MTSISHAASQDTSTDLNIKVTGSQDLALNETAVTAASSKLDASSLTGKLALGIDFGSGGTTLTDLSLGSSNLVVTPQDSVAIVNLPFSNAKIELGINLDTVTFGYNDQPTAGEFNRAQCSTRKCWCDACPCNNWVYRCRRGNNSLTIISNDGGNIVNNIVDSALTKLVLSGPTSLEIDAIGGITANNIQNIVIDATSLAGNLVLNASGIVDTAVGGRQVQIDTGSGHSIISDTMPNRNLGFTIGSGNCN